MTHISIKSLTRKVPGYNENPLQNLQELTINFTGSSNINDEAIERLSTTISKESPKLQKLTIAFS